MWHGPWSFAFWSVWSINIWSIPLERPSFLLGPQRTSAFPGLEPLRDLRDRRHFRGIVRRSGELIVLPSIGSSSALARLLNPLLDQKVWPSAAETLPKQHDFKHRSLIFLVVMATCQHIAADAKKAPTFFTSPGSLPAKTAASGLH